MDGWKGKDRDDDGVLIADAESTHSKRVKHGLNGGNSHGDLSELRLRPHVSSSDISAALEHFYYT